MLNQHKSYIIFKIVYERVSKNDLGLSGSERPRVMQINMKPIQFVHFDVLHFSLWLIFHFWTRFREQSIFSEITI